MVIYGEKYTINITPERIILIPNRDFYYLPKTIYDINTTGGDASLLNIGPYLTDTIIFTLSRSQQITRSNKIIHDSNTFLEDNGYAYTYGKSKYNELLYIKYINYDKILFYRYTNIIMKYGAQSDITIDAMDNIIKYEY